MSQLPQQPVQAQPPQPQPEPTTIPTTMGPTQLAMNVVPAMPGAGSPPPGVTPYMWLILTIVGMFIAGVPPAILAWASMRKTVEVHDLVNSRMTELLEITRTSERAKGVLAERQREAASTQPEQPTPTPKPTGERP